MLTFNQEILGIVVTNICMCVNILWNTGVNGIGGLRRGANLSYFEIIFFYLIFVYGIFSDCSKLLLGQKRPEVNSVQSSRMDGESKKKPKRKYTI